MAPVKPNESNPNRTSSQDSINDFLNKSQISSSNDIAAFLGKVKTMHSTGREHRTGRLMFAMDATASREPSWDQACHLQSEMFLEALNIGKLEVQLAYFRGYGEFKVTKWLSNSKSLLNSMLQVRCLGGQTQIEKVLKQAVKENRNKINRLELCSHILIIEHFERGSHRIRECNYSSANCSRQCCCDEILRNRTNSTSLS